jgi:hypothetical protein
MHFRLFPPPLGESLQGSLRAAFFLAGFPGDALICVAHSPDAFQGEQLKWAAQFVTTFGMSLV